MDAQQLFNVTAGVLGILLTIIGAGITWWVNTIWSDLKDAKRELGALQINLQAQITQANMRMVEHYMPRVELEKIFDKLTTGMDEIKKELKQISNHQAQFRALRPLPGDQA